MRFRHTLLAAALSLGVLLGIAPPPAHAGPATTVGASVLDPRLGNIKIERVYRDGRIGDVPRNRPVALTFLAWDEQEVRQTVRRLHRGSLIGYWHEPEDDIERGKGPTAEQHADRSTRLAQIVKQERRVGQVTPMSVFMVYSLKKESGRARMMERLVPPRLVKALREANGTIGWDVYAGERAGRDASDMYGDARRFTAARGMRYSILETGARQDPWDNPAALARQWDEMTDYARRYPPRWFFVWNPPDKANGVYAVQRYPRSAEQVRQFVRQSR